MNFKHKMTMLTQEAQSPSLSSTDKSGKAQQKKRKRKKYLIQAAVLIVLLMFHSLYKGHQVKPISVTIEKAHKKTIVELVNATGKVQPEVEVKISPEVAGEIIELPVIDGQLVKKGQLLLRIKPDNYQAQVDQEEAAISSAKAVSLQNKSALDKALSDLRRSEELYSKRIVSESDITAARTVAETAKAVYEAALYQVQQAESKLQQARDLLAKTIIVAPLDGKVTQINNKLGERVVATGQFAGTDVMHVADVEHMEARVNVNENDLVNVHLNDKATIAIDAFPGKTFEGTVYQIANTAVTTGENTQEQVTNFEVRIRIEQNVKDALRPGMSATADIEVARVADVVAIPIQAVTMRNKNSKLSPEEIELTKAKNGGAEFNNTKQASEDKLERASERQVVFVKDKNRPKTVQQREVVTGISDNSDIEVKQGLHAGDEVVTGPYSAITRQLKDGAVIRSQ